MELDLNKELEIFCKHKCPYKYGVSYEHTVEEYDEEYIGWDTINYVGCTNICTSCLVEMFIKEVNNLRSLKNLRRHSNEFHDTNTHR